MANNDGKMSARFQDCSINYYCLPMIERSVDSTPGDNRALNQLPAVVMQSFDCCLIDDL